MLYWKEYKSHDPCIMGRKNKFDNTIYTFDIETSNYLILNNKIIAGCDYEKLNQKDKDNSLKQSNMYIWQFSINENVYYGRTWEELKLFLNKLELEVPERKIVFIHNLSFEFQYLKGFFKMEDVIARKSRKVMRASFQDYNIELRCSYMMSNCKLEKLPKVYGLPVKKQVGYLDYDKIRHSNTYLSDDELKYCEYDCLVVYEYIKKELLTYENVDKIPLTSTGHVRRELKNLVLKDYKYKGIVRRAINTDPHIYNLLIDAFAGGYTHANWLYADEVLENITSYDFTSSYPYIMVTHKFPAFDFKKCNIKSINQMSTRFAYLLVVKLTNVKSKLYNNFISMSKCKSIKGGKYDNGRIIEAKELITTITDIDFRLFYESYNFEYEIIECYFSLYKYLPKQFIEFVLQKYVNKTQYKDVEEKKLEYQLEKAKFNSLYGMSVTNMIRDNVVYDNIKGWEEIPLTNEEIEEKLLEEKKKAFLSFAYGVWVTAYARNNLLKNVIKLDENVVYCDTDSIKLTQGFDYNVIENYNNFVEKKVNYVSKVLDIDINKFAPKDIKGKKHMLGLFECDGTYQEFITQGAKKYAYKQDNEIHITVAGVPKTGASALNRLEDFKDNFVFKHSDTGKNVLQYNDNQVSIDLIDYQGNILKVTDKSGCCILPTTYVLGKSLEYADLISDNSSARARYKE